MKTLLFLFIFNLYIDCPKEMAEFDQIIRWLEEASAICAEVCTQDLANSK